MNVLLQRQEGERSYRDMFKRYYKRVFIACSAQALAQLNGINVISYYAPLVFEQAGWVGRDAILMTGINGLTYLASTVPPWYLVDRLGRRFILMWGAIAMVISLSAISYFIHIDIHWTPRLVVIFVMIYNGAFGASWGPIPWLYPPEILPMSIRAKGASLSTASNWAFNWVVGELTPVLQELISWRLYLVHAFFCAVSFVVGKSLLESYTTTSPADYCSVLYLPRNCERPSGRHELNLRRCNHRRTKSTDCCRGRVAFQWKPLACAFDPPCGRQQSGLTSTRPRHRSSGIGNRKRQTRSQRALERGSRWLDQQHCQEG